MSPDDVVAPVVNVRQMSVNLAHGKIFDILSCLKGSDIAHAVLIIVFGDVVDRLKILARFAIRCVNDCSAETVEVLRFGL